MLRLGALVGIPVSAQHEPCPTVAAHARIAAACRMRQAPVMTNPADTSWDHLNDWIGRTEQRDDIVTAAPLAGLIATLDRVDDPAPLAGTALPPLAHWLYFLPQA